MKHGPDKSNTPAPSGEDAHSKRPHHLLDVLMNGVSDYVYFKDRDSRFVLISRSLSEVFKLSSPDDAIGLSDFDFYDREQANRTLADEKRVIESGLPMVNKVEHEKWPDGSESWVSTTKMPIVAESGEVIGTFGISRDITSEAIAQEALQQSQSQLSQILNSITDGFMSLDESFKITYANPAAEKLLFRNASLLIGRNLPQIFPGQVGEEIKQRAIESMQTREVKDTEVFDSPRQRWLLFRIYPSKQEALLYFRDVTLRRQAEDAQKDQQKRLEELVRERTSELTEANAQLQREIAERHRAEAALVQSERLEAISSMASGIAINFSNILEVIHEYAVSISNRTIPRTQAHEEAERILTSSRRGIELVNLLTGVGQSNHVGKKLKITTVPLGPVLSEAVGLMSGLFAERNIETVMPEPEDMPAVRAVQSQLQDVVSMLLMNAYEAMPEGGRIRIDCLEKKVNAPNAKMAPKARAGRFVILRIRDEGEGISSEDLAHIFEPFYSTRHSDTSLGLGLAYARGFVQSIGGWIGVRSIVGQGTSIRVFLPHAKEARVTGKEKQAGSRKKPKTILLLDDDPDTLAEMRRALTAVGWKGLYAGSIAEARSLISRHKASVAAYVFDAHMNNGSTDELITFVHQQAQGAKVVLLSGFSREYVRSVTTPRSWAFLQKPFEEKQLVDVIESLFGESE